MAESTHTVKMSNGSLIRKTVVAIQKSNTPRKRVAEGLPKPPTPAMLRKKLAESTKLAATSGTIRKRNSKQGRQIESEDSETDSDGQLLASKRVMGKLILASVPEAPPPISFQHKRTERAVTELAATEQEATKGTTGAV